MPRVFRIEVQVALFFLAVMLCRAPLHAGVASSLNRHPQGCVAIVVRNSEGALVPHAPVYFYNGYGISVVAEAGPSGMAAVKLPAGIYRVSSAMAQPHADYVGHSASYEAQIRVTPGDEVFVVLTLHPIDPPDYDLNTTLLHKTGIDPQVARDFH
jgi:hypothetical protein